MFEPSVDDPGPNPSLSNSTAARADIEGATVDPAPYPGVCFDLMLCNESRGESGSPLSAGQPNEAVGLAGTRGPRAAIKSYSNVSYNIIRQ